MNCCRIPLHRVGLQLVNWQVFERESNSCITSGYLAVIGSPYSGLCATIQSVSYKHIIVDEVWICFVKTYWGHNRFNLNCIYIDLETLKCHFCTYWSHSLSLTVSGGIKPNMLSVPGFVACYHFLFDREANCIACLIKTLEIKMLAIYKCKLQLANDQGFLTYSQG